MPPFGCSTLLWKPSSHERAELRCPVPRIPSLCLFAGEEHMCRALLSLPAHAAIHLTLPSPSQGGVQRLCWHSSLACLDQADETEREPSGLIQSWVGCAGREQSGTGSCASFITFCLRHMGRIRSCVFISTSWGLGVWTEIYARV